MRIINFWSLRKQKEKEKILSSSLQQFYSFQKNLNWAEA